MANDEVKVLTDSETLQELAARIGRKRLLKEMADTEAVTHWTANEMLKGKYQKSPRLVTQRELLRALRKYGLTSEMLFKRVPARSRAG